MRRLRKCLRGVTAYGGQVGSGHGDGVAGREKQGSHLIPVTRSGFVDIFANVRYRPYPVPGAFLVYCRERHIRRLAIFGSALRSDFTPDSDIDLLVEFEPDHIPGPFWNRTSGTGTGCTVWRTQDTTFAHRKT